MQMASLRFKHQSLRGLSIQSSICVSAFAPPEFLWNKLLAGHSLLFKEYLNTSIPPDRVSMNSLDVVCNWKEYSKSLRGLGSALVDNATRLMDWKYKSYLARNGSLETNFERVYTSLVQMSVREMRRILWFYNGVDRVVLAGTCYSKFLIAEKTIHSFNQLNLDCESIDLSRCQTLYCLNDRHEPNIMNWPTSDDVIEQGEGYIVERRNSFLSGSGFRYTYVEIDDIELIKPGELVKWLLSGHRVHFSGKTIYKHDDQGLVFGDDGYGQEFYAGKIVKPDTILRSLRGSTMAENYQDGR